MAITAVCPKCSKKYELADSLGGKTVRCKECNETFRLPVAPPPRHTIKTPYREAILTHLEKRIGPSKNIIRESISDEIRLDLHVFPPTDEEPSQYHLLGTKHFTVATSGLSATPMKVPSGSKASPLAELMIALPRNWPGMNPDGTIDAKVIAEPRNYWPFRWLKRIARLPHAHGTLLEPGLVVANSPRAEPFASSTRLGCMLVFPSTLSHKATYLTIDESTRIEFFALYPLYPEEMKLKFSQGLEALLERFAQSGMTELIRPDRGSMVV